MILHAWVSVARGKVPVIVKEQDMGNPGPNIQTISLPLLLTFSHHTPSPLRSAPLSLHVFFSSISLLFFLLDVTIIINDPPNFFMTLTQR